jgi:hypothetical protein
VTVQRVVIAVVVEADSPSFLDLVAGARAAVLSALRGAALGDEGTHIPVRYLPDGTPLTVSVYAVDEITNMIANQVIGLTVSDILFEERN